MLLCKSSNKKLEILQEAYGPEDLVFKHFKEGRHKWQIKLEGGNQAEPYQLSISRNLINCKCRAEH
jgi:hypothetical protein